MRSVPLGSSRSGGFPHRPPRPRMAPHGASWRITDVMAATRCATDWQPRTSKFEPHLLSSYFPRYTCVYYIVAISEARVGDSYALYPP